MEKTICWRTGGRFRVPVERVVWIRLFFSVRIRIRSLWGTVIRDSNECNFIEWIKAKLLFI